MWYVLVALLLGHFVYINTVTHTCVFVCVCMYFLNSTFNINSRWLHFEYMYTYIFSATNNFQNKFEFGFRHGIRNYRKSILIFDLKHHDKTSQITKMTMLECEKLNVIWNLNLLIYMTQSKQKIKHILLYSFKSYFLTLRLYSL